MSKKISKTIMSLIVFVVFLGIGIFAGVGNVFAYNNYSTTCVYGHGTNAEFIFHVNHDGGLTLINKIDENTVDWEGSDLLEFWEGYWTYPFKRTETVDLQNWGPKFQGFSGSEYYVNHEENGKRKCPPNAIYIEYMYSHDLILTDGSKEHLENVEIHYMAEENTADIHHPVDTFVDFVGYCAKTVTGSMQENGAAHLTEVHDLIAQYYYDEPDIKNEEVIDDGTVREWVNPKIKTVTPLEEDDYNYSCGNGMITGIPSRIPKFGKFLYNFLQFLVPIVLVLMGTIDLVKATSGGKEDDIKKNQMIFVKRLISAVLIFFSFAIIKLVLSVVAEESAPIIECTDCIIRHSSNCIVEIK